MCSARTRVPTEFYVASSHQRGLLERAGLQMDTDGVTGWHGPRVGVTCTLLAAGLCPNIVQAIGFWESPDMVTRYGRQYARDPSCVQPLAFYNPKSLRAQYTRESNEAPGKRRRVTNTNSHS